MTEFTDEELVLRAKEATRLLEDPLLKEAFVDLEKHYIDIWKASTDPDERGEIWVKLQVLLDLIGDLRMIIENGEWITEQNK